jgi:uncharacterized membrane protein YraQ (UPF0718 family)
MLSFLLLACALLAWAKWLPYQHKLVHLWRAPEWSGKDLLATAGGPGSAPSFARAWAFTRAYFVAVLPAVVAGLTIAAGIQALVSRRRLLGLLGRSSPGRSSLAGGLLSLPSLMCTCCTAPVAATLRREGAPTAAALAYWLGNPVLNPVVLAFLAIVAPWQWVLTRVLAGGVLVFGASALIARVTAPVRPAAPGSAAPAPGPVSDFRLGAAPLSFGRALGRLTLTLVPEYILVVFLLGLFRGWLFPLGAGVAHWALLGTVAAAVLGTMMVVPTAGEIPVVQGLAAAGVGTGPVGALLITLPAISLVSMAMVARAFSLRVTAAAAAAVTACGLLGALLLTSLG